MGPCAVDDEDLAGGLGGIKGLPLPVEVCEWARLHCGSIEQFGWQELSGTEFGTDKGVLSFAPVGDGDLHAVL